MPPAGVEPARFSARIFKILVATSYTKGACGTSIAHSTGICTVVLGKDSCTAMFHCENDLLANLIVLSPKVARKRFRESIFEDWCWQCAYCDKHLNDCTATIDHIIPKHKGGHNTRNNLAASCTSCNRAKGSQHVFEYMSPSHQHYSEQRVGKLKKWMEQKPCSLKIVPTAQAIPYICHDATLGWIAT
jgi:hypothetical protein